MEMLADLDELRELDEPLAPLLPTELLQPHELYAILLLYARIEYRIAAGRFPIPSPKQVEKVEKLASKDPSVFVEAVAEFGIPYPAPIGWGSYLNGIWCWEGEAIHDTVFNEPFRVKWLRIESGIRVPLLDISRKEPNTFSCENFPCTLQVRKNSS